MKVQPIDDRLLIKPLEEEEKKTPGGLIIPDTAKEKPQVGEVIAVGDSEEVKDLFEVGDKVIYAKYSGNEISIDGEDYLIVQKSDILAKVIDG